MVSPHGNYGWLALWDTACELCDITECDITLVIHSMGGIEVLMHSCRQGGSWPNKSKGQLIWIDAADGLTRFRRGGLLRCIFPVIKMYVEKPLS